jgi:hypothetical protein
MLSVVSPEFSTGSLLLLDLGILVLLLAELVPLAGLAALVSAGFGAVIPAGPAGCAGGTGVPAAVVLLALGSVLIGAGVAGLGCPAGTLTAICGLSSAGGVASDTPVSL